MLPVAPGAIGEAAGGPERFHVAGMHSIFGALRSLRQRYNDGDRSAVRYTGLAEHFASRQTDGGLRGAIPQGVILEVANVLDA